MSTARVPLSEIAVGQSGTIITIGVTGPLRRRLLALGLITGEVVTITRVAPLGDPLELEVKGYRLSLRKAEASQILIAPHP